MKQKQPLALLFSDCHVRKGKTDEFKKNMEEIFSICEEKNISTLLFGGDMFYSSSSQSLDVLQAVKWFTYELMDRGITCHAIAGNHDKVNRGSNESYLDIFLCERFIVGDCFKYDFGSFDVCMCGYYNESTVFRDKFKSFKEDFFLKNNKNDRKRMLILHQGINGGLSSHSDNNKELEPELFSEFDKVLVGHYHDRNKVSDNIQYIGSSRQFNHGECELKGYTIIYDDMSTEFIQNEANMRYVTIEATKKTLEQKLEHCKQYIEDGYYVRLSLECTENEKKLIDKQAIYQIGVSQIQFKVENEDISVEQSASFDKLDKGKIKEKYSEFCDKKEISAELGNKYLDQIQ